MHFKNGREAKNGDKVVLLQKPWTDSSGKIHYSAPVVGVLYDAKPGVTACNGYLAPLAGSAVANLNDCLHVDDFVAAQPAEVPDTSKTS